MSKRRMFNQDIVSSDAFLDMPGSSQNLYFHLNMNADDYGFVSPKKIMRMTNSSHDDLQVLIAKRYILNFESGVVVIKHWQINNTVRKDRSHMTTYKVEFESLINNEFGAYTERRKILHTIDAVENATTKLVEQTEVGNQMATNGKPNGNQMATEIRLDKIRVDYKTLDKSKVYSKNRAEKVSTETLNGLMEFWELTIGMNVDSAGNRKACAALLRQLKMDEDKLKQLIAGVALSHNDQYAPRISDFVSLKRKMNDLIIWGKKRNNVSGNVEVLS